MHSGDSDGPSGASDDDDDVRLELPPVFVHPDGVDGEQRDELEKQTRHLVRAAFPRCRGPRFSAAYGRTACTVGGASTGQPPSASVHPRPAWAMCVRCAALTQLFASSLLACAQHDLFCGMHALWCSPGSVAVEVVAECKCCATTAPMCGCLPCACVHDGPFSGTGCRWRMRSWEGWGGGGGDERVECVTPCVDATVCLPVAADTPSPPLSLCKHYFSHLRCPAAFQ
jgi:hypothetical protein